MMARRVYGLSIALSVMAWRVCAAQAGDDLAAVRRAIDAQNHAWEEATKAGDARRSPASFPTAASMGAGGF